MNKPLIHQSAWRQAREFIADCCRQLSTDVFNPDKQGMLDLQVHLAQFDACRIRQHWKNYELLTQVRRKAQRLYLALFQRTNHTAQDWAFLKLRLEMALLKTIEADETVITSCELWGDVRTRLAYRLVQAEGREPGWWKMPFVNNQVVLFVTSLHCRFPN